MVQYIVDNGAYLDVQDDHGYTAVIYAVYYQFHEIAAYIREHGKK